MAESTEALGRFAVVRRGLFLEPNLPANPTRADSRASYFAAIIQVCTRSPSNLLPTLIFYSAGSVAATVCVLSFFSRASVASGRNHSGSVTASSGRVSFVNTIAIAVSVSNSPFVGLEAPAVRKVVLAPLVSLGRSHCFNFSIIIIIIYYCYYYRYFLLWGNGRRGFKTRAASRQGHDHLFTLLIAFCFFLRRL